MRVLIVDDEPAIRDLLQTACEEEGHEARTAASVPEALELWRGSNPDCIVLDLRLPGAPGTELVRHVRLAGDRTPIVVISGNLRSDWLAVLEQFGVTAIIPKPFDVYAVVALLRTLDPHG